MESTRRATLVSFSLAIVLSVLAATALPAGAKAEEEITPSTAIARLMIVKGTAWVRHADSGEWEENSHNSPVVERSRVSIPRDSESENSNTFSSTSFCSENFARSWACSFLSKPNHLAMPKNTAMTGTTESTE